MLIQTRKDIKTQTRQRWDIPNEQSTEISRSELALGPSPQSFSILSNNVRVEYSPIYNCHGLTFASRRTSIFDVGAVRKIIRDDAYEKIQPNEVKPGDIVLYVSEDGDIYHSGVVVSFPKAPLFIPTVCSKWGKGPEVLHSANVGPYSYSNPEYYRIGQ